MMKEEGLARLSAGSVATELKLIVVMQGKISTEATITGLVDMVAVLQKAKKMAILLTELERQYITKPTLIIGIKLDGIIFYWDILMSRALMQHGQE